MGLPLPFKIPDEDIQGNFDEISKQFPLSHRHLTTPTPVTVGSGAPAPGFSGTWAAFAGRKVRYWKDALGLVHIQGTLAGGTINTTAFVLPQGWRPGEDLTFASDTNSGHGRVDVTSSGLVIPVSGGTTYFALTLPPFLQEN